MLQAPGDASVVCADSSAERLGQLSQRLRREGLGVICTRSAAECLSMAAEYRPRIIVLDSDFLEVDQENIPEYISRISASTAVVLTVDEPEDWQNRAPQFIEAFLKRGDLDSIASLVLQLN